MPWVMRGLPKGYTNSNPYYSIRYPADWNIDSSDANLTPEKQGAILSISKGDVEFQIIARSADSSPSRYPTVCQFPDSNYKENLIVNGDYIEIKSGDNIYRTTDVLPFTGGAVGSGYKTVCFKKSNEEKFTNKIGQMNINYKTLTGFDDKDIEIMNRMLSTFQFE